MAGPTFRETRMSRAAHALDALNFSLADVRDRLGPYLAVDLLAIHHWDEASTALGLILARGRNPATNGCD